MMQTTKTRNTLRILRVWPKNHNELFAGATVPLTLQDYGLPPFKEMMSLMAHAIVAERMYKRYLRNHGLLLDQSIGDHSILQERSMGCRVKDAECPLCDSPPDSNSS